MRRPLLLEQLTITWVRSRQVASASRPKHARFAKLGFLPSSSVVDTFTSSSPLVASVSMRCPHTVHHHPRCMKTVMNVLINQFVEGGCSPGAEWIPSARLLPSRQAERTRRCAILTLTRLSRLVALRGAASVSADPTPTGSLVCPDRRCLAPATHQAEKCLQYRRWPPVLPVWLPRGSFGQCPRSPSDRIPHKEGGGAQLAGTGK